jgi:hypothetical protein
VNAKTQYQLIASHLKSGKSLTALEALRQFGSLRLGARVWELKRDGMPIVKRMVRVGEKTVARYYAL